MTLLSSQPKVLAATAVINSDMSMAAIIVESKDAKSEHISSPFS